MKLLLFVIISLFLLQNGVDGQSEPIANTPLGQIKGSRMVSVAGRDFEAYRGIPYAKPPIGDLRFEDPVAVEPWNGVFDATHDGPMCFQFDPFSGGFKGTEDCLVVNVYTHSSGTNERRPVMVWIHGGGWAMGSGSGETDAFGPNFFLDRDIVLVTLNYRLGPLGFLSTDDVESPGNYGLLDQTLALKWVHDYIEHFGGDPESVTIFGCSAGGAAVHFHVLSPLSKGLFKRAIIQSGSSLNSWATLKTVGKYSKLLAKSANCPVSPSKEMMDCLKTKSAEEILAYIVSLIMEAGMPVIAFGPRVDAERSSPALPEHPTELLRKGQFNHVPLIVGTIQNEGLSPLALSGLITGNKGRIALFNQNPAAFMIAPLSIQGDPDAIQVTQKALEEYYNFGEPLEQQFSALERMISDHNFFHGIDEAVRLHTQYNSDPVYYYFYTHRGFYSLLDMIGVSPDLNLGVCHGDEIYLMFTNRLVPPSTVPEDVRVSKLLIDLWTSFAYRGVPTSEAVDNWSPTAPNKPVYLNINANPVVMNQEMPFHDRMTFWDQIRRSFSGRDEL